jgi:imidazolonepropionase
VVMPGFVDPHTHIIFAGKRPDDFEARLLQGESFLDAINAGGGSLRTIAWTRAAPSAQLADLVELRLRRMLGQGTTTAEVKSGYGLTVEQELRHLEVLRTAAGRVPIRVVPTALGAHFRPPEQRDDPEPYVRDLCERFTPRVAERRLATTVDVFCEPGVYSREQSRRILQAARDHGLGARVHADQLSYSGGAELAVEMGALSADHLGHVSPAGIEALARSRTVAVLIPGSLLFVPGEQAPPARELVAAGVAVAISSDYNPGSSPMTSQALAVTLACVLFKLSVAEALAAATINAAWAVGLQDEVGSLEVGKRADLILLEADDYREVAYRVGENLVRTVLVGGEVVVERPPVGPL